MFFYHSVMCLDIIQAHDTYFLGEKISFESLNEDADWLITEGIGQNGKKFKNG